MLQSEYQAKFTIKDIETKTDKNFNPYYLIHFTNSKHQYGYAFASKLEKQTLSTLEQAPYKLVNQRVKITYSFNHLATHSFLIIKSISLIN